MDIEIFYTPNFLNSLLRFGGAFGEYLGLKGCVTTNSFNMPLFDNYDMILHHSPLVYFLLLHNYFYLVTTEKYKR